MSKYRLYNTTNVDDMFKLGSPIRYESNAKDMYYETYRLIRKAYHTGKELELLICSDSSFSCLFNATTFGILLTRYGKAIWMKEGE